jgi:hypothetical protein
LFDHPVAGSGLTLVTSPAIAHSMALSQEYQIGSHTLHMHVRFTFIIGAVPLLLAPLYMYYMNDAGAILMWLAIGVCLGLLMMTWGGYEILFLSRPQTQWGRALHERGHRWFPLFLIASRYVLFSMGFLIIWYAAIHLGFPINRWMTTIFFAVLLIQPFHRTLQLLVEPGVSKPWDFVAELFRFLNTNAILLFILSFLSSGKQTQVGESATSPVDVALWMIPVLVFISTLILFADRIVNYDKHHRNRRP